MNTYDIRISEINQCNLTELLEISKTTFTETFASQNSEENMKLYIYENLNEATLRSEINSPTSKFYFVYYKDELAGYLKLNFPGKSADTSNNNLLEIERIYILKIFQRMGLGQALYLYSKEIAKSHDLKGVWLGVWERNILAQRFYKKNGFRQTGSHVFTLGEDDQTDIIMRLEF